MELAAAAVKSTVFATAGAHAEQVPFFRFIVALGFAQMALVFVFFRVGRAGSNVFNSLDDALSGERHAAREQTTSLVLHH